MTQFLSPSPSWLAGAAGIPSMAPEWHMEQASLPSISCGVVLAAPLPEGTLGVTRLAGVISPGPRGLAGAAGMPSMAPEWHMEQASLPAMSCGVTGRSFLCERRSRGQCHEQRRTGSDRH